MPPTSKQRRTLEDLEAAAEIFRPVQDRLVYSIAIDQVRPSTRNPRHRLEGLDELADSLQEYGLLQPVVVRRVEGGHELIAGHRRMAAAQQLGWTEIAAVVRDETDDRAYLMTLTENLQREDLSPKEEAEALEVLVRERGWTTRQIGQAIKRSHIYVSRRLRVFEDDVLVGPVLAGQIAVSTAEELLRAEPEARPKFVERAIAEDWGQAQARRAVLERNVPSATNLSRAVVEAATQVQGLLNQGAVSDLTAAARVELRRLYRRLALLVAD